MNIDFSKAPEGAAHYDNHDGFVSWWKKTDFGWCIKNFDGNSWVGVNCVDDPVLNEIPKENKMLIHCKTEREVMLCEQVLRMCRGEKSQFKSKTDGKWVDKLASAIYVDIEYRAKPKKELVVPWEFISDDINKIVIDENKNICHIHDDGHFSCYITSIKLDLIDIDLPVTVKRPEVK